MSIDRLIRINALLRREIAEALFRIMHEQDFDVGAVTVTQVAASRDLREARVSISIRDHEAERARMLHTLERHRGRIQQMINRDIGLKFTPRLTFVLDRSVEKGDRVLGVLAQMDQEAPQKAQADPPAPAEPPNPQEQP